jgi:galactokinase
MNKIATTIKENFVKNFSSQPNLYFSPGRINLIGEHVDYNDGFVLPAAIDKGIYYAIAKNETGEINFYSIDFNERFSVNISEIKKTDSWKNYVLSVVNEFLLLGKEIEGFDCVFGGDIPQGSGMSSSAAVEGGLAFALNQLFNCGLNRIELAKLCQRAEHNFPGVQCGIMDQFANMMGQKNNVILLDCKSLAYQYFPLMLEDYKIVLINSKVHHSLASGEYNIRRKQCEEGLLILKKEMKIDSFRDIANIDDLLAYKSQMKEQVFMRCLYVVEEIKRTKTAAILLQENNLVEFGKLMYATNEGLSYLYEVSCKELDFLVDQAKKNEVVIGARLMGGGFGGCTINLVKEQSVQKFIEQTSQIYQQQFNISPEAYIVEISKGTDSYI